MIKLSTYWDVTTVPLQFYSLVRLARKPSETSKDAKRYSYSKYKILFLPID